MPLPRAPRRVEYQNLFKCQARCTFPLQLKLSSGIPAGRQKRVWGSHGNRQSCHCHDPHLWCLEARGEQRSPWTPTLKLPAAFAFFFFFDSPLLSPAVLLYPAFIGKMSYEFCCSNLKAVIKTNFICFSFRTPPTGDPSYLLSLPAQLPFVLLLFLLLLLLLLRLLHRFNTGQQIKSHFSNKYWS